MKRGRFYPLAEALFDGAGTPRYREGIIGEIDRALESTHADGRAEGRADARREILREGKAMLEGFAQTITARLRDLEIELANLEKAERDRRTVK